MLVSATPSVDVSGSETGNGVTSVARARTVEVFGTATNTNPATLQVIG